MLQNNPVITKIKKGITTKILNELASLANHEKDVYLSFWKNKLTWLAEEFTQGQIQINPIKKNETCRNCGYSMLCRIAESASNENNLGNLDG